MKPADDPFDEGLKLPIDESPEDRALRIAREDEARRVSPATDASIKVERHARWKKRIARLLLFGQSEFGSELQNRAPHRSYPDYADILSSPPGPEGLAHGPRTRSERIGPFFPRSLYAYIIAEASVN